MLHASFSKALDYFSTIPQLNNALKVYVYTYTHWMVIHVHFSRSNATKKNGVTFRILKKKTDLNLILITGQTDQLENKLITNANQGQQHILPEKIVETR